MAIRSVDIISIAWKRRKRLVSKKSPRTLAGVEFRGRLKRHHLTKTEVKK